MNVLPVLVGLPQSSYDESATQGVGSPIGEFARLLDQTLSGTTLSGGMQESAPPRPSSPYVSPTRQSSETSSALTDPPGSEARSRELSGQSRNDTRQAENDRATTTADTSPSQSDASRSHGAEAAGTDPGKKSQERGANKGGKPPGEKSEPDAAKSLGRHGSHASKDGRTTAAQDSADKAAVAKNEKKNSGAGGATAIPGFPGAVILSGGSKNLKSAVAAEKTGAQIRMAAKSASAAVGQSMKGQKPKSAGSPEQAATGLKAAAKELKKTGKTLKDVQAAQEQLAASGTTTAGQAGPGLPSAINAGPGLSNIQQQPPDAASPGHTGVGNQNSAVTIIDLRHPNESSGSNANQGGGSGQQSDGANVRLFQLADGGATAGSKMNGQGGMIRAGGAAASGQSFGALTDQIVKQTGILLKDNNSGEIRLVLKPERLGSLRIKIDMNDHNLTGRILVQNHEALKLVQQNLDALYRALRDSGFTATALNVSVGGREGEAEKDRERHSPLPSMRAVAGVKGFDNQAPALESAGNNYSLVNLVV